MFRFFTFSHTSSGCFNLNYHIPLPLTEAIYYQVVQHATCCLFTTNATNITKKKNCCHKKGNKKSISKKKKRVERSMVILTCTEFCSFFRRICVRMPASSSSTLWLIPTETSTNLARYVHAKHRLSAMKSEKRVSIREMLIESIKLWTVCNYTDYTTRHVEFIRNFNSFALSSCYNENLEKKKWSGNASGS